MFVTYPDVHLSGCFDARREVVVGGALCTVLDLLEWFPHNVACNFHVNLSNLEIISLEFQRLWGVSKTDRRELHATFVWTRPAYATRLRGGRTRGGRTWRGP